MADGGATFALMAVSLAVSAVGTGMQVYSANQAASNERSIAEYNQRIAENNAKLQHAVAVRSAQTDQYNAQLAMAQATAQGEQAEFNARWQEYNAQVQQANAQTLRNYAEATLKSGENYAASTEDQGREEVRRMRLEKLQRIAGIRSQIAASGITMEGSPLAVLADEAGRNELAIADAWWATTNQANKLRYDAEHEASKLTYEAQVKDSEASAMFGEAASTRSVGKYQSLLSMTSANYDYNNAIFSEKAAGAGYRISKMQAGMERQAGNNRADAYTLQGYSAAVSGAADASSTLLNYNYNKPKATG